MDRKEYSDRVLTFLRRLTPEEQAAVRAELDGHIEDHMEALIELGYAPQLAEERTMSAMGNPEEVGRELERQYPMGWLVLGRIAVVLAVSACFQAVLAFGMLGMFYDSVSARIYPNEETRLRQTEASERIDLRVPVGDDVLRVYRVSVGERGEEPHLREAEVSLCAYDRIPGGIVSERLLSEIRVENQRGESGNGSGGRGNWRAEYTRRYVPLAEGDTFLTVEYDRMGRQVFLKIPLPEGQP